VGASPVSAQVGINERGSLLSPGLEGEADENEAWEALLVGKPVRARQLAERIVKKRPTSYIAHFILGQVHQDAEADFPRALYHFDAAMRLFENHYGQKPGSGAPWQWHARILRELAEAYGNLERFSERLAYMARFNELYDPHYIAERAWPLLKLGRYQEARYAAQKGLQSGDPVQEILALNALCAIEFEAGNDGQSYQACLRALDYSRDRRGSVSVVDLTNLAEAARSLFRLDEAERLALEATRLRAVSYGNPWIELAELYVREGRFAEALSALKEVHAYRLRRPPYAQESDRNEGRRALAALFLVIGRPDDAMRITSKAVVSPDRRAHNSRDPGQDQAIVALLDRRARRMAAQQILERGAGEPWTTRVGARLRATWLQFQGWMSGREASKLLSDPQRLKGVFRIGTSRSAVIQPWLAGDLIELLGPAVAVRSLEASRKVDHRHAAGAYYDALNAEAAFALGHKQKTLALAEKALSGLGQAEVLLRARMEAIAAQSAFELGAKQNALRHYAQALDSDPGIFRRLDLTLPVQVRYQSTPYTQLAADKIFESPRFEEEEGGLEVTIANGRMCLRVPVVDVMLGCASFQLASGQTASDTVRNWLRQFHHDVFAPRVPMTQADANSLDGSNRVVRNPIKSLLGDEPL